MSLDARDADARSRAAAVACVVPARFAASRFPGKLLQPLDGVPIIVRTLRRAAAAGCFSEIICLTDSQEISAVATAEGFSTVLCGEAANGTDRIGRNLDKIPADLIINLQGDEPVFPLDGLRILRDALLSRPARAHTLVHAEAPSPEDLANPHRVKAALDAEGCVIDFYRSEFARPCASIRLQMGAYGYGKDFLRRYAAHPISTREIAESHELLRSLDLAPVQANACRGVSQAIDVPQDLEKAAALLRRGLGGGPQTPNHPAERMTIIDPNKETRGSRVEA
jgi:3-deoxy-manno-octulosonate cytidylyltransferase (CMP-KDO synthetase)